MCCSLEHWSSCDCAGSSMGCRLFASCGELGLLLTVVHGLLIVVASLAVEHGLQGPQASLAATHRLSNCSLQAPEHMRSVVVAHRLSCSTACGIFQAQGWNLCLLHWQVDFVPLRHQRRPSDFLFNITSSVVCAFVYVCNFLCFLFFGIWTIFSFFLFFPGF